EKRQKFVDVPTERIIEKIVEVPKFVDKIVEVPVIQKIQKFVEVPKIEKVPRYVDKPVSTTQEQIVEVPKIEYVDKIVEVPQVRKVTKYIEVPEIRYVDKIVDVPKIICVEKIVEITKDSHERVQEETNTVFVDNGKESIVGQQSHEQQYLEGDALEPKTNSVKHEWDVAAAQAGMQNYNNVQLPMLPRDQYGSLEHAALGASRSNLGGSISGMNLGASFGQFGLGKLTSATDHLDASRGSRFNVQMPTVQLPGFGQQQAE
ncbi:unnamed protein product, partial [Amoebophrya sp. A120]